jgi:hypothetical protein
MSPNGTVRPGVMVSPGGTIRHEVLKDNWVEGGWNPLTREKLRKEGNAQGKDRVSWFADDLDDESKDGSKGTPMNRQHFILSRRRDRDHLRLSTSHRQLVAIGHTGTQGLDTDWGGQLGGRVTRRAVLRILSCVVVLIDCMVLAIRDVSRHPYHKPGYNPKGILGYSRTVVVNTSKWSASLNTTAHYIDTVADFHSGYGWGEPRTVDAFLDMSLLGFLLWDLFVSVVITAEICGRHWHIVSSYLERRRQRRMAELAARLAEVEKKRADEEEEDLRSAAELQAEIDAHEERLKGLRHELQVKKLSTKPATAMQMILGRSLKDKQALQVIRSEIDLHVSQLTITQQRLTALQELERMKDREAFVLTQHPHDLENSLQQSAQVLKMAKREKGAVNYIILRLRSHEQTINIKRLEAEVAEIKANIELLRTLRPQSDEGKQSSLSSSSWASSNFSSEGSDQHVSGLFQRRLFVQEKRLKEFKALESFLAALDLVVVCSSWLQIVLAPLGVPFTLRPLRLFRALYWFSIEFCIHAIRGLFHGLAVARKYVEASIILLLVYAVVESTFFYKIFSLEGAHYRCVLCPLKGASSAHGFSGPVKSEVNTSKPQNNASNASHIVSQTSKNNTFDQALLGTTGLENTKRCYDVNYRWNVTDSPVPTFLVPEQWCRVGAVGNTGCPAPFDCVNVQDFVEFTPFHFDNYLGINSVLYSVLSMDGEAAELITNLKRSVHAYSGLFDVLITSFIVFAVVLGTTILRSSVAYFLSSMWRRVPLVDTDCSWFRIEGWAPWEANRPRPTYLPPPVDYGPSLAAGNMSPISAASSPVIATMRSAYKHRRTHMLRMPTHMLMIRMKVPECASYAHDRHTHTGSPVGVKAEFHEQ